MKADYDSQANALAIELIEVGQWDDGDEFDDTFCRPSQGVMTSMPKN